MGIIGAAVICYHININDAAYISLESADRFKYFVADWSWVPLISFTVIALGTLSGGWKIIKTMGTKITKVTPIDGVAAETAGAVTLFMTEHLGIPVSTTHTITGSIVGVGITKRLSAVRWKVTLKLLWAWVLTIPVSALIAAIIYYIISFFIN
jgi:PiT family inorganic phosphate transporter